MGVRLVTHRSVSAGVVVGVAAALLATPALQAAASAQPASRPSGIRLTLVPHPADPAAGSAVVDVVVSGLGGDASGLAGFEVVLTAGAQVTAAVPAPAGFTDVSMSGLDRYAVLAAYRPASATGLPEGPGGSVRLGTVQLDGVTSPAQVRASAVRLVAADGTPIPPASGEAGVVVGPGAGTPTPAPSAPYAFASARPAARKGPTGTSGAGSLPELAVAWNQARLSTAGPCGPEARALDVTGDGCLDVGDLVRAAPPAAGELVSPRSRGAQQLAGGFTVDSTGDAWDAAPGNGVCRTAAGACTLRAAIQEANARSGPDTIRFAIPGTGVKTIQLVRTLPALNDPSGGTTVDGYTQAGATPNTAALTDNAQLRIEIRGNGASGDGVTSGFDGLPIASAGNVVRGVAVYNVRRGIWINGSGATGNAVVGSFIGTDATGRFGTPAEELEAIGIKVELNAAGTTIGTTGAGVTPTLADRNVVSGNGRQGIALWHNGTDGAVIVNNLVGLSPDGTRAVPNRKHGVDLNFGVSGTVVGGTGTNERNVISGNGDDGVEISHTPLTTANLVRGNYIGTDVTGNAAPAHTRNADAGVYLEDGSTANTVERNVIANSGRGGIVVIDGGTNGSSSGNVFRDNRVGIGAGGAALPNAGFGVALNGTANTFGPGNVVRFNQGPGVRVDETDAARNRITRNVIADNGGLAIDLSPVGTVNPNDPGDTDAGANGLQNSPELVASAGSITGTACAGCAVELFTTGAAGGYGPLRSYLGTATASSTGTFDFPNTLGLGTAVSAVAVSPRGDTSEAARNVTVVAAGNRAPTVSAGPDITVDPGTGTVFTAAASDPDGTAPAVLWDLDGNGTYESSGNPVTFPAPATGPATITVRVKAIDPGGLTATDARVVTVRSAPTGPRPPTARVVVPGETAAGVPVPVRVDQLSAAGLTIAFDCGSGFGPAGTTRTATCPAGLPPTRLVKVRVTDPATALSTTYPGLVAVHPNLLANAGFEAGSTTPSGWTWGPGRQWVTSPVYAGSRALASVGTGSAYGATASQTVGGLRDTVYRLDAKVAVPSTGSGSVSLVARWLNAAGAIEATVPVATASSPTGGWADFGGSFRYRAGAAKLRIDVVWTTTNRAIAVDQLTLRHASTLANGDLEADANGDGRPDGWAQQARFTRTQALAYTGTSSGRATGDGAGFTVAQRVTHLSAGSTYLVSGWVNAPAGGGTYTVTARVRWWDDAQQTLRLDHVKTYGTGRTPLSTPGWEQFAGRLTAPAGATQANVELFFSSGMSGSAYLDSVVLTLD